MSVDAPPQFRGLDAQLGEKGIDDTVRLIEQSQKEMGRLHMLVMVGLGEFPGT